MVKRAALLLLVGCATTQPSATTIPDYDRKAWKHWIDEDRDCQDTRQEVLIAESEVPVTYENERECRVESGRWLDPYTSKVITDPGLLDIDHMVALRDAHDSGGHAWSAEQKREFANDLTEPDHLMAVDRGANRSKGSRGPDEWLPPNPAYRCEYIRSWLAIKGQWDLDMTIPETMMIEYMLRVCDSGCVPPLPQ